MSEPVPLTQPPTVDDKSPLKPAPPAGAKGTTPGLPERLGRYRITGKLGAGGFGVVYQGHDDERVQDTLCTSFVDN